MSDTRLCPDGPGTRLKRKLNSWGFKEQKGKCPCLRYARKMNLNGPKWCRKNQKRIVGWLRKSAKGRRLPFSQLIANRWIRQAIEEYEGDNMGLREYFQKVYCVNLNRRNDRWKRFKKNLPADWPFAPVERIAAIDGKLVKPPEWWKQGGGAWGCYRSHLRLIEQALNTGVESILLLEDDALFPEDFTQRVTEFLQHVPEDWGMIYLGGQHLFVNSHAPNRINDWVYQPYNVNRTHAFALRGETMLKVYRHLCTNDWHNKNHIDHHLGRLHQRREDPIYCPKEWLIGQAAGRSNISGKSPDDRFWKAASHLAETDPDEHPFYAVLGIHSSGSSCMAGVLYHLGLHLGNTLKGFYGNKPGKNCGYEADGLISICEAAIPMPTTELAMKRGKVWGRLRTWINARRREAAEKGTYAAGKYPQLCRLGNQLINICEDKLRVIDIDRPLEESIESLIRRQAPRKGPTGDPVALEAHQRWLYEGKQQTLERIPEDRRIKIEYHALLANPRQEIERLVEWIGLDIREDAIKAAIASVNPDKRNVVLS